MCQQIFDNVQTTEDLNDAEKVLLRFILTRLQTTCLMIVNNYGISFRRGYSAPRPSTPRVVVRACIRVGKPRRALHFIKHKVGGVVNSAN